MSRDRLPIDEGDVIAAAVARLTLGEILAIKGLGGYHLVCDARNADAVARMRLRKSREETVSGNGRERVRSARYCDAERRRAAAA